MRILMTMFGWADSGGGTILPREIARTLRARGHDVAVVYAAAAPLAGAGPYAVREQVDDGVQLVAIHNRPVPFLDAKAPARELHDAEVVRIVRGVVAAFRPDVAHFHNFLGLSAGIAEATREAGVPSCCSLHNFWPVCPTLYLTLPDLSVCGGVDARGANCVRCARADGPGELFVARRDRIRELLVANVGAVLAASANVRDVMLANGYAPQRLRLLHPANERAERIWREVGAARVPGVAGPLRIGFMGSVLPIKGVHVLVAAAQRLRGACEVHLHGDAPPDYAAALRALDRRGLVRFHGAYGADQQPARLASCDVGVVPSVCLDHSPRVIVEWQAARTPVVGARIGGIPDYVQPGCGALVAPGDPDALAVELQRLLDAPATLAEWQRRLAPPRPFAGYVQALEDLYRELRAHPLQPA